MRSVDIDDRMDDFDGMVELLAVFIWACRQTRKEDASASR